MKKVLKYFILSFLIFFLVSNFTILNEFLPNCTPFRFCSNACGYQAYELDFKGFTLEHIEKSFAEYRVNNKKPDLILHRRFYRKWWQIWNWYDFLTHRRWSLPYAKTDEET